MDILKILSVIEIYCFILFYLLVLYSFTTVVLGKMFGLKVIEVSIFGGPIRKIYRIAGVTVKRKTIPLGCSITFNNKYSDQKDYDGTKNIEDLEFWQFILLSYSGCIGLLVFSLAVIGADSTIEHFITAYQQIYVGAIEPKTYGVELIEKFYAVHEQSVFTAFGVLSVKMMALNIVPFLSSASHHVIAECLSRYCSVPVKTSFGIFSGIILMLPLLIPIIGWSIAYSYYLFWLI